MEALRQYERTSAAQLLDASNIMAGAVSNPPSSGIQVSTSQKVAVNNCPMSSGLSPAKTTAAATSPTFILIGCTFTGCSVAFSGQALHQSTKNEEQRICEEMLLGIEYDDIFKD